MQATASLTFPPSQPIRMVSDISRQNSMIAWMSPTIHTSIETSFCYRSIDSIGVHKHAANRLSDEFADGVFARLRSAVNCDDHLLGQIVV